MASFAGLAGAGADGGGVDLVPPPLLPGKAYLLRHGRRAESGDDLSRAKVTDDEGTPDWDGTYGYQSSPGLCLSILSQVRSQGRWSQEQAWVEVSDPGNVGAAWLRRQEDPDAVFEQMWDDAFVHGPKVSFEQLVVVLLALVEEQPGARLTVLREAAACHGWRNRGEMDSKLAGLVSKGVLREERTYGPSGGVSSRRFWKVTPAAPVEVARAQTSTLSLALRAVESSRSVVGHKDPQEGGWSYRCLLTDKKLRARGLRCLRARWAPPRQRPASSIVEGAAHSQQRPPLGSTPEEVLAAMQPDLDEMFPTADEGPVGSGGHSGPPRPAPGGAGPQAGGGGSRPRLGLQDLRAMASDVLAKQVPVVVDIERDGLLAELVDQPERHVDEEPHAERDDAEDDVQGVVDALGRPEPQDGVVVALGLDSPALHDLLLDGHGESVLAVVVVGRGGASGLGHERASVRVVSGIAGSVPMCGPAAEVNVSGARHAGLCPGHSGQRQRLRAVWQGEAGGECPGSLQRVQC